MKRGILLTALVASVTSAAVTALVMLALLPSALHAQGAPGAQTAAAGLTVTRADGLAGVTADVRPTGGGELTILGTDGKTVRAHLGAGGAPAGQPPSAAAAGLEIDDANGNGIGRFGTQGGNTPIGVLLTDGQGNDRFLASLDQNGNPSIKMYDASGNVIWSAP